MSKAFLKERANGRDDVDGGQGRRGCAEERQDVRSRRMWFFAFFGAGAKWTDRDGVDENLVCLMADGEDLGW